MKYGCKTIKRVFVAFPCASFLSKVPLFIFDAFHAHPPQHFFYPCIHLSVVIMTEAGIGSVVKRNACVFLWENPLIVYNSSLLIVVMRGYARMLHCISTTKRTSHAMSFYLYIYIHRNYPEAGIGSVVKRSVCVYGKTID